MRTTAHIGDPENPLACEVVFRKSSVSRVVIDLEYGNPVMVEYRRNLDALALYFTDITGENHEFLLAPVP